MTDHLLLSLCMIVRDSAKTLPACLASICPWVDEIIIVDTGSTDDTRQIAQSFGATIHEFPWIDDFSAARNESLRHAQGEWVFWMDSDDTILPECGERLRALARGSHRGTTLGYVMQVYCPGPDGIDAGDCVVVDHVKLFRNRPDLRFEGRIHEQIIPAIRRKSGEVEWTDLFVVHSGADHSPAARERKFERDLRILQLDLAERPDHPFVLFNLGMTFNDMGKHEEAVAWLQRALGASDPSESHLRKVYALLVASLTALGHLDEAQQTLAQGLALFPKDAELLFRQGIVLHRLGKLEEAASVYRRLLRDREPRHLVSIDSGIVGHKGRHNLALVYSDLGRQDLAELEWRLIAEMLPDYQAAWSALADSLLQQRKLTALEYLLDNFPQTPSLLQERHLLLAELAMARRDFASVRQAIEAFTGDRDRDLRFHRLRCHYLFECGTLGEAEAALERFRDLEADNAVTLHNLGLAYHRGGKYEQASAALRRSLKLRPNAAQTRDLLLEVERQIGVA